MDFKFGNLNLAIAVTSAIVFGVVAAIIALLLSFFRLSGAMGIAGWLLASLSFLAIQWYFSPTLIRWISGAREVSQKEAPLLHQTIARLARKAGIPKPKLYLVEDNSPNAFAFGRTQKDSGIAVHSGLLKILEKNEVEAVLAHEIGHIKNQDVIVMTLASALPVMLYYGVLIFGSKRGGILALVGAFAARMLGQLMVLWLSRQREYAADAFSAQATRKPASLMSALAKISYAGIAIEGGKPSLNAFYISAPNSTEEEGIIEMAKAISTGNSAKLAHAIEKEKKIGKWELLMTHPVTAKRIEALMKMQKGAAA